MPHCVNCGYDLRGLPPDHRCPECGELTDAAALGQQAQAWYASWRGLLGIGAPPAALLYLRDPRSQSLARRRLVLFCLLPLLLPGVLAVAFDSVRVVNVYERWLTRPDRPGERIDIDQCMRERARFSRFGLGESQSVHGRHRRVQTHWRVAWPHFKAMVLSTSLPPIIFGLAGLAAFRLCLALFRHWSPAPRPELPPMSSSMPALTRLAPYHVLAGLLWALSALLDALDVWDMLPLSALVEITWLAALVTFAVGGACCFGDALWDCGARHGRTGSTIRLLGAITWIAGTLLVLFVLTWPGILGWMVLDRLETYLCHLRT